MGDNSEADIRDTAGIQLAALKSSSTNVRIEVLRKLLHAIQDPGESFVLPDRRMKTNPSQPRILMQSQR